MDSLFINLISALELLSPEVLLALGFFTCIAFILLAFRFFGALGLVCYSVLAVTIANMQVLKLGAFSYINEPVALGTVMFTTLFTTSDLITEHYGADLAKKTIYLTFLMQIFVILSMVLVIAHPEAGNQKTSIQVALEALFTPSLRLLIASLIAFIISQHIDICIFSAFIVKICVIIMGKLIDSESNWKKKLGALFIFGISALGIWIILVMIAISE
jgi:uncharacterized integral membrane protein (TIGR00697 family)